jgi:peptidoglycan/LPS O-acetylase OafA/YrhL
MQGAPVSGGGHFRPDVEGLRGIAILLVIAFHAAPDHFAGGFIGVDVFFVISGFLITGLLFRELQRAGRIDVAHFYARRARRLLPAAALALGVTLLLSALVIAPLDLPRVTGDAVAAAASVANIRFAIESGDYFSAVSTPSPFLHYWSLSLEEQFYLVWPALLLIVFRSTTSGRGRWLLLATVAGISFVSAILITDVAVNWAFYSLPTRAWQLALGGLLAISALGFRDARTPRSRSAGGLLAIVGWLGLGAVLVGGFGLDSGLAYPGLWALIPTLGAVAIVAAGDGRFGPGIVLRTAPLRFLGRISYALYLWHWPLLVLPAIAIGAELSAEARVALVVLAVLIATASTLIIEEPIRRSPIATRGRPQLVMTGALALVLLGSVSVGVGAVSWVTESAMAQSRAGPVAAGDRDDDGAAARPSRTNRSTEVATPRPPASAVATPAPAPPKRGPKPPTRSARRSRVTPAPKATPRPTPRPTPKAALRREPVIALPADVRPSVWKAPEDEELLRRNGCLEAESATVPRRCVFGDKSGKRVMVLLGDSHASHWFPALNKVAKAHGWRLETFVKVSCPFTDMPVRNLRLKRTYRECEQFNENTVAALRKLKPDLVVTAQFRFQYPVRSEDESDAAQGAAIARMLERVPGTKAIIADVPFPSHDVPACLSKHLKDVRPCAVASFRRSSGGSPARERIAAKRSGAKLINLGRRICGGPGDCPVVSEGMILYRDEHHLTATYARSLAPALERKLKKLMRAAG